MSLHSPIAAAPNTAIAAKPFTIEKHLEMWGRNMRFQIDFPDIRIGQLDISIYPRVLWTWRFKHSWRIDTSEAAHWVVRIPPARIAYYKKGY